MVKHYFFLLFFFFSITINAQNWLDGAGGGSNDEALDVASDTAGNYYVTGYFTTQATFGITTLVSSGNSDIFIAKYNSAGIVQWAVSAGGSNADRAYSIKADDAGNLYITGFYYGTAKFGASTITSVSNSQDVFIAKYNTNGNLIWVKTVGGADAETGNGITMDNAGNVIITGQFKGTSKFGTTTLTSTPDTLGLPSFDIFTTKFDATGNFLWVKQGKAKFDDRGLDVAIDDANNIFVVGQFSDTIKFDVTHNNASAGVGYLMKYDQNGNEKWFVKMVAHQTIVNSIAVDPGNNVFITGDYIGNLQIYANPAVSNTGSFFYKVFIAKFNNSGSVVWVDNDGSDNEVTSKSIAIDNLGDAYIAGLFKCKFGEYSAQYGNGVFYSSGYRDVFVTKYSASGARKWFKQFGSNKDDYCSGIAVKVLDKPVIAGSFEVTFNVPYSPAFKVSATNSQYNGTGGACSSTNSYYENFIFQNAVAQKDIFVTSPIDTDQAPFDYFQRGSVCKQNFISPCIENCQDTINSCGPIFGGLNANTFQTGVPTLDPHYNYTWSTGSKSELSNTIFTSGIYWLRSQREDGCFQNQDSVYIAIHPAPVAPWISDSHLKNVNQPPSTKPIAVCGPDTIRLSGTHTANTVSVKWSPSPFATINDSTIDVTSSGQYSVTVTNKFGCTNYNTINIDIQSPLVISPVIDPHIVFLDSTLQATDSISICYGTKVYPKFIDSGYIALNGGIIPGKTITWNIIPNVEIVNYQTNDPIYIKFLHTGLYTFYDTIYGASNLCSTDVTKFPIKRSFYVKVNPTPTMGIIITGRNNVCPGDTITLYAKGNISNTIWSGSNIVQQTNDSIKVVLASSNDQFYSAAVSYTVATTGCNNDTSVNFILYPRPYPHVTISPSDGIICPNDSALLTTELGKKYNWIGPAGDSIGNTQSVYVNVPGFYHCIQTSVDGCKQTSNFAEAKIYTTPYIDVLPNSNLCPKSSAVISVQASNSALIQWQAPLSGSSISNTISSPGTYICRITQCGILTIDSVVVTQTPVPAFITSSDSIVCPGDTIVLNGNPGMVGYNWLTQNSSNSYLYITTPGIYTLETTHANGCTNISAPFTVKTKPQVAEPFVSDTTICSGQIIDISATASDSVLWYNSKSGKTPIYVGDIFTTPQINHNTVFYVQTYAQKNDPVCKSNKEPVHINVFSTSILATTDKDTIRAGESTTLHAITNSTYTVKWLPVTGVSNPHSFNPTVSPLVSTTYTVTILDEQGCPSFATVFIYVISMNCEVSDVFVPNTFTPNNDNNNDFLFVRSKEISELYFAVFNRWGIKVFETNDIKKGWDGTYNGKEEDPVVFDWYLKAKCFSGSSIEKKGNVTLIR